MRSHFAKQVREPREPMLDMVWHNPATDERKRWNGSRWIIYHKRFAKLPWKGSEDKLIRQHYPDKGPKACEALLPGRSRAAIVARAIRLKIRVKRELLRGNSSGLTREETALAVHRYVVDKVPMEAVARELGRKAATVSNAVLAEVGRLEGNTPAERDQNGALSENGLRRLRALLEAGARGRDIMVQLAISASTVTNERRRENARRAADGRPPLPPAGNGVSYSGAKLTFDKKVAIATTMMSGATIDETFAEHGISKATVVRIRTRLIASLAAYNRKLPFAGSKPGARTAVLARVAPPPRETVVWLLDPSTAKRDRGARLTFDEQMKMVTLGSQLVTVRAIRKADPSMTLGGIATGQL